MLIAYCPWQQVKFLDDAPLLPENCDKLIGMVIPPETQQKIEEVLTYPLYTHRKKCGRGND